MDLLPILRTLGRYWWLAIAIGAVTLAGVAYGFVAMPRVYESDASLVILSPPAALNAQDIAANPGLAKIQSDNPYSRLDDRSLVEIVTQFLGRSDVRQEMRAAGATGSFSITAARAPSIADITATGATASESARTAAVVRKRFARQLLDLQKQQNIADAYLVKVEDVGAVSDGTWKVTTTLRMSIGILVGGFIALVVGLSIAEAVREGRRSRSAQPTPVEAPPERESDDQVAVPAWWNQLPNSSV